jgi:hypothetical protein
VVDQVRADTDDLVAFVDAGSTYRSALQGVFLDLEAAQSTASSMLGFAPPGRWIDPFRELVAEAQFNDRFVDTIVQALADFTADLPPGARPADGVRAAPPSAIDAALAEAGLVTDGSDRSLIDDLLAVLDDDQLQAYEDLVAAGMSPLRAEMLVSSEDPAVERYIDGVRLDVLNARIETWTGSENAAEFDALVAERNELLAELVGDHRHWLYEPQVVALAAQNGLTYEEADFALVTTTIDALAAELYAGGGHPGGVDPALTEALAAEVDRLADGDEELARHIRLELAGGASAAEALFDAVGEVYGEQSIAELLSVLESRAGDPQAFDPIGMALQATLVTSVEEFTGADVAEVNLNIAAMAQENDLTYNTAVAMINLDMAAEDSDWPPGSQPLAYLDVPITDGLEAAFMLAADEEGLFRAIETANQGDLDKWDGKLSDSDWQAVLESPELYSDQAVAIAGFFADNPEEWLAFDTAREGGALTSLADGEYAAHGEGDGIASLADVHQYLTNRQVFDTLLTELERDGTVLIDSDGNGRFDESELEAVLDRISDTHPNYENLTAAVNHTLDAELLDFPDDRAWYEQIGDGLYRITSLTPGSPTWMHRVVTDPDGLIGDYGSMALGAGEAVVGIGLFAYDVSAMSPLGAGFWVEYARTGGDMEQHRGWQLTQALPHMAGAGLSLIPGTPQYDAAMLEVRRQGTWDAHPGVNMGLAIVDWETFVDDPARWAGQFLPDILVTVATGGGGAITRLGSTGSRIATGFRHATTSIGRHGLRHTLSTGGRQLALRGTNLVLEWRNGTVRLTTHIRSDWRPAGQWLPRPGNQIWRSRPVRGTVADANFAQNNRVRPNKAFSPEGQAYFSNVAGFDINTVEDLAQAIRTGAVRVDQVPVDYVIVDGQKLILNTRTSTALRMANVPQSQWYGRDKTGLLAYLDPERGPVLFEDLGQGQLDRNNLGAEGSPRLGIDPPDMVRGGDGPPAEITERQINNGHLRNSPLFGRDMNRVGVTEADIEAMMQGRKPLGFTSEAQYQQFSEELSEALVADGLADAEIGLKGTATTFYSENPGKPFGHHWDADPANIGDYDLNMTSGTMVDVMDDLGIAVSDKYGIYRAEDIASNFEALQAFRERWTELLGRDVNIVGLPEAPPRDVTEYIVVAGS